MHDARCGSKFLDSQLLVAVYWKDYLSCLSQVASATSVKNLLSLDVLVPRESLSRPSIRRFADLYAGATLLGSVLQLAHFQSRFGFLGHLHLRSQLANSYKVPAGILTSITIDRRDQASRSVIHEHGIPPRSFRSSFVSLSDAPVSSLQLSRLWPD